MKITTYYYEKACQSEEEFRTALKVARENTVEEIIDKAWEYIVKATREERWSKADLIKAIKK